MKATQEWIERACNIIKNVDVPPLHYVAGSERKWLLANKPEITVPEECPNTKVNAVLKEVGKEAIEQTFTKERCLEYFKHDAKVDDKSDNTLVLHYEFKPCPFCGKQPTILIDKCYYPNIGCSDCDIEVTIENTGVDSLANKLQRLSDRWNKRSS